MVSSLLLLLGLVSAPAPSPLAAIAAQGEADAVEAARAALESTAPDAPARAERFDAFAEALEGAGRFEELLTASDAEAALEEVAADRSRLDVVALWRASALKELGRAGEALSIEQEVLARWVEIHGPFARRCTDVRADLAYTFAIVGDRNAALAERERVVEGRLAEDPPNPVNIGKAYFNVGVSRYERDELFEAQRAFEGARDHFSAALGDLDEKSLAAMTAISVVRSNRGDRAGATAELRTIVAAYERNGQGRTFAGFEARHNLLSMLVNGERYAEAVELGVPLHADLRDSEWSSHRIATFVGAALATALRREARNEEALDVARAAADSARPRLPDSLEQFVEANIQVASVMHELGRYEDAHAHLNGVVTDFASSLPDESKARRAALSDLGILLSSLGYFDEALESHRAAADAVGAAYEEHSADRLDSDVNVIAALIEVGRLDEAEARFSAFETRLGHPNVTPRFRTNALSLLAALRRARGDFEGAAVVGAQIVERLETGSGESNASRQATVNLAGDLQRAGALEDALGHYDDAIEQIHASEIPQSAPIAINARLGRANVLIEMERADEALVGLEAVHDDLLAGDRPASGRELAGLHLAFARAADATGETGTAALYAWEALAQVDRSQLPVGSELWTATRLEAAVLASELGLRGRADALTDDLAVGLEGAIDEVRGLPRRSARGLAERLAVVWPVLFTARPSADAAWDARVLDLMERMRQAVHARRPVEDRATRERLEELGVRIAQLAAPGRNEGENPGVDLALARAVEERDALLRRMASSGQAAASIGALAERLADDERLVSFVTLPGDTADSRELVALVMDRNARVSRVGIGSLADVTRDANAWRAALGIGERRARASGLGSSRAPVAREPARRATLREALLDPIVTACGDARRLHVVPDGIVHLVPLDALGAPEGAVDPLDTEGLEIRIGATGCELLVDRAQPAESAVGVLLVGGIAFDPNSASFPRLRGTAAEIERLGHVLRGLDESHTVEVLRGGDASKDALRASLPNARIVHIATHSFAREIAAPVEAGGTRSAIVTHAPLAACGIALAGAFDAGDAEDVLTGEEITSLDLTRCELVVLSACRSNRGLVRTGQGTQSLVTALHAAGAGAVVASLWDVPDEATSELMGEFYANHLVQKMSARDALDAARRTLRDRGLPAAAWAGWVLRESGR
ncbi:MAG: CHAT domain-containing protein [Planctomycetota bacterium]